MAVTVVPIDIRKWQDLATTWMIPHTCTGVGIYNLQHGYVSLVIWRTRHASR
jgi:hypothetical protein